MNWDGYEIMRTFIERTLYVIVILLVALLYLMVSPVKAEAKSKAEVAQNCLSFSDARAAYPRDRLRYRLVDRRQCWYAPGKQLVAKKIPRKNPGGAGDALQVPPSNGASASPIAGREPATFPPAPTTEEMLDNVFLALCGAHRCPSEFDLRWRGL